MATAPRPPLNFGPHARVSFGGSIEQASMPPEIWNCNVSVCKNVGGDLNPEGFLDDCQGYANTIAPALKAWWAQVPGSATSAKLEYVKVNNILPNGHYQDLVTHETLIVAQGGSQTQIYPSILSIATSWRTAISRGRGARGRIYLPNYATTSFAPGSMMVDPAAINNIVTAGVQLLNVLQGGGSVAPPFTDAPANHVAVPVVASAVDGSVHRITRVEAGNIWDVQRRRKSAYAELYSGLTWPT